MTLQYSKHFSVLLCCFAEFIFSMNFYNTLDLMSYAIYQPWEDSAVGQATLEFRFKTNQPNGLLLNCDDGDEKKNFFQLKLSGGKLRVNFKMGSNDFLSKKGTSIGSMWNDMEWHHVKVTRNYRDVHVRIDDQEKTLTSDGSTDRIILTSNVLIGRNVKATESGFTGCIKGLAYSTGREEDAISTMGDVNDMCLDKCLVQDQVQLKCENNGKCVKYFQEGQTKCDCTATGASGPTCSKTGPVVFFEKGTIMSQSGVESLRFSRVNRIELRFRTNDASGIILYGGDMSNYILIELVEGVIKVLASLGTGSLTLSAGDGSLHDGLWHSVFVRRYGQHVFADVDAGRFEDMKTFPYYPTKSCRKEDIKVYVGGHKEAKVLDISESRQNFTGCLQQVNYHQSDLTFIKLIEQPNISLGCPIKTSHINLKSTPHSSPQTTRESRVDIDAAKLPGGDVADFKQQSSRMKLSQSAVAGITGGICVGVVALIFTLACGFYFVRKRYSGKFLSQNDGHFRRTVYGTGSAQTDDDGYNIDDGYNVHSKKHTNPTVV